MSSPESSDRAALTIDRIKRDIERRAAERQARVLRGEVDVPVHYHPLPVNRLFEVAAQLAYRVDVLELAALPDSDSLAGRLKAFLKGLACRALRWLHIRQVEFNRLVLESAVESARQTTSADQNVAELYASVRALKLQLHSLAERLARVESGRAGPAEMGLVALAAEEVEASAPAAPPAAVDGGKVAVYLDQFRGRGPVLNIGCGRGEFLRAALTEGLWVQGVEPDEERADYCRERELPVVCEEGGRHLARLEDNFLGGVYLDRVTESLPARDVTGLFRRCWLKLRKGGALVVEIAGDAPAGDVGSGVTRRAAATPVEWLDVLLEAQSFTVVDHVFSDPLREGLRPVVRTGMGRPYDRKDYQRHAVIARK